MFIEKDNVTFVTFDGVLSSCVPGKDCEVLKIPEGVKKVDFSVLDSDNGIKEIYFPESLEEISSCAFVQCEKLEKIHFSSCLKRIEDRAFLGCKRLREVALPSSLEVIAEDAFSGCSGLKQVTVEENGFFKVTEKGVIDRRSGNIVISLQHVVKAEAVFTRAKLKPYEKDGLVVPKGTKVIPDEAFASDRDIEQAIIPEGVKKIGKRAFKLCLNLKKVILPEGLEIIDEEAFAGCGSLTEIIFPKGLQEIGEFAFFYCVGLEKTEFPKSLKNIGDHAFSGCLALEEVVLPDGTESVGNSAFSECENLKRIAIPDGMMFFGKNIVQGSRPKIVIEIPKNLDCIYPKEIFGANDPIIKIIEGTNEIGEAGLSLLYGVRKIRISYGVKKIGANALYGLTQAKSLEVDENNPYYRSENNCIIRREDNVLIAGCRTSVIPDGVTAIGEKAFFGIIDPSFTVNMPDSVTEIGEEAFSDCYNLTEIRFSKNLQKIGQGAFSDCGISNLDLPGTVKEIPDFCFSGCFDLVKVKINEGTETISNRAFAFCPTLTEVDLPYSLKKLGKAVFELDMSITSVKIPEKLKLKTLWKKLGLKRENQIVYK